MEEFDTNCSIDEAYPGHQEAQAAALFNARPIPGFFPASNPEYMVDTSGIDSLLVIVRVLMALGCKFTKPVVPLGHQVPFGKGCTPEEQMVIRIARMSLGWKRVQDTQWKLDLIKGLNADYDEETSAYPSLRDLLNMDSLANIWENNEIFTVVNTCSLSDPPNQDSPPQKTFWNVRLILKIDWTNTNESLQPVVENLFKETLTNSGKIRQLLCFYPPFIRVTTPPDSILDFRAIRRLTINAPGFYGTPENHGSRPVSRTYSLLMVIRHAGKGVNAPRDRVRIYKENGHEHCPTQVGSDFDYTSHKSSVRHPEPWSLRDGGEFTLVFFRMSSMNIELDINAPEFNESKAWKDPGPTGNQSSSLHQFTFSRNGMTASANLTIDEARAIIFPDAIALVPNSGEDSESRPNKRA